MFVSQPRIRIVAAVTSVFCMNCISSADETTERFLPPVEVGNTAAETAPSRIFSSGPVNRELVQSAPMADPTPNVINPPRPTPVPPAAQTQAAPAVAQPRAAIQATPVPVPEPDTMDHGGTIVVPNSLPFEQQYFEPTYQNAPTYCTAPQMPHHWFSAQALIWWTSQVDVPVIATTSPQGTPGLQAGILGQPQTSELWGGGDLFDLTRRGVRLRGGEWFDDNDGSGWQAEFLMLGSAGHDFFGASNGDSILGRPFLNEETGLQDSQLIAFPGLSSGSLAFNAETRLYSVGLNYWAELIVETEESCGECGQPKSCDCCRNSDTTLGLKIGPRFIHHDDTVLVDESLTGLASGNQFRILDSFKTENSFLGSEIGIRARRNRGAATFDLGLNLGIGATRQELDVSGITSITNGAVTTTSPGGFFAQSTNSGSWDRTKFSLVPSLECAVGFEAGNGWRFSVGYDLMYWTNVLRAAEQIDPVINPNLFPPAAAPATATRPSPVLNESDYFAHGISISIERRW